MSDSEDRDIDFLSLGARPKEQRKMTSRRTSSRGRRQKDTTVIQLTEAGVSTLEETISLTACSASQSKTDTSDRFEKIMDKLNEVTNVLQNILTKFDSLITTYQKKTIEQIDKNIVTEIESDLEQTVVEKQTAMKELQSTLHSLLEKENNQEQCNMQTMNMLIESEALRVKNSILSVWNNTFFERSKHFWQAIRNMKMSEVYQRWISSTPVTIPRKFQIPKIKGEPENQRFIREQRLLEAIKSEIELNRLRAENHTDKYKQLDNDMHRIISNKSNCASKSLLLSWWKETCEQAEMRSQYRWTSKNEKLLEQYEKDFHNSNKENPYIKTYTQQDKYSNNAGRSYKTALLSESRNTNRKFPRREQRQNSYNIERNQSPHKFKYKELTNGVQQKHKYTNRNHQERFTKRNETVYIGKRMHQTNRTNKPSNNNIDFEERARRRQNNNFRTANFGTDDTDGSRRRGDHFLWNRTRPPQRR